MKTIDQIWNELEQNPDAEYPENILSRLYDPAISAFIVIGLQGGVKNRCLILRVSSVEAKKIRKSFNYKGFSFFQAVDPDHPATHVYLVLALTEHHYTSVFTSLCQDIIDHLTPVKEETEIIKRFLNRLKVWETLFDRFKQEGLSEEEQRGLYGELYFLRKLLNHSADYISCVQSWTGPTGGIQDFQFNSWAVEVKTSIGNNHQKIYISNERQLDNKSLHNLFLYYLSLDSRQGAEETLPALIKEVRELLVSDRNLLSYFNDKLLEGGYYDAHIDLYAGTSYSIRKEFSFQVGESFPRLTEKDIPAGVGDIKYTINVSNCLPFEIKESELFNTICHD